MANWSDLKAAVASIVKTNGNKEITGQLLQNVLNNIISNVGLNSSFAGIATPETNPGAPDGNVFYLAYLFWWRIFYRKSIRTQLEIV